MLIKSKKNEQGFTFVEILTCLAIIALVVGPICFSFLSSLKTRVTAESINEATAHAEQLLEDVKVQITDDIILRQKVIGNRIATDSYTSDLTIAKEGVGQYLIDLTSAGATRSKFAMTHFLKDTTLEKLNARYNTSKYAYEVALWRVNDIPFINDSSTATKTLTLDDNTIKKATKFYTDSNSDYQFDVTKYAAMTQPITFQVSDEMLRAFNDRELAYVPNQDSTEAAIKILDKNTITIKDTILSTTPSITDDVVNWRKSTGTAGEDAAIEISRIEPIRDTVGIVGYTFTIIPGGDSSGFEADAANYRGIIELDVRALLRKSTDLTNETAYDQLTFKFINTTPYNQLIVVRKNLVKSNDSAEAELIEKKFNIVAEDAGVGKSSIIRVDDIEAYENYVIAIIVREKNPALGEEGKIVKKIIDIFSYDVTKNQRR